MKMTRAQKDEARLLYESQEDAWSYAKLGKKYGVAMSTIATLAAKEKWNLKNKNEQKRILLKKSDEKTIERASDEIAELNTRMLGTAKKALSIIEEQVDALYNRVQESKKKGNLAFPPQNTMRAVVLNYEKLVHSVRLQTGQTTGKNESDLTLKAPPVALVEFVDAVIKPKEE